MTRPVLNLADAPSHAGSNGDSFAYEMRELAGPLGAERIGANVTMVSISTCVLPEVVGYPDSGKTGVRIAATMEPDARFLAADSAKAAVGYWDREDGSGIAALVGTGGD